MRLLMVAANTFTELIRDKALLGLLAFAVIVIAISGAFGMISAGEEVKFIIDISLPAMLYAMLPWILLSRGNRASAVPACRAYNSGYICIAGPLRP